MSDKPDRKDTGMMSRQYSPKTFLRQVPKTLLGRYFQHEGIRMGLRWWALEGDKTAVERIFQELLRLPTDTFQKVESDFSMINELSSARGTVSLLEAAVSRGQGHWVELFKGARNAYEPAIWAFLEDREVFYEAGNLHMMDRLGAWRRWYVGAGLEPAGDLTKLEAEIAAFFQAQGRGRFCHVDRYIRQNPVRHCYFAYPEDYARTDMVYSEDGQFQPHRPWRSAFEVIFVYRPEDGILELRACGKKDQKEALVRIFCRTVLGLAELPDDRNWRYDLTVFKDRTFGFRTDRRDGIQAVHIRQLGLALPGETENRLIVSARPSRDVPAAVYDLLDTAINEANYPKAKITLVSAKLQVLFAPNGYAKPKTLTFQVAQPDRCTLRDDPYDQIARKYLKRWRVDCA